MEIQDSAGAILDTLCKHLVTSGAYTVLGVMEDETLVPYGVSYPDEFRWPVADFPELVPMMEFFDFILFRSSGLGLDIVFIKNRIPDLAPQISASLDQIKQIGRESSYIDPDGKMVVNIQLWELTTSSNSGVRHLHDLRQLVDFNHRVHVSAWSLNTSTMDVWTNAFFNGFFLGRKSTEKTLSRAVSGEAPIQKTSVELGTSYRLPLLTFGILGIICVVFVFQLMAGEYTPVLSPTIQSLVDFGGQYKYEVLVNNQWYRLISSTFLHADPLHLVFNAIPLIFCGIFLESLIGRAWLMTVFFLSLLGGSAASFVVNGPEIVSVGVSGAVMGMLATGYTISFRLPYGPEQTSTQIHLVYWLIPALLPIFPGESAEEIDFAAHLGGAVVGFAVGLFIIKTWKLDEGMPRFHKLALAIGGVGALLIYLSLVEAYANRA